tara:strand:- start:5212 stop:7164 length:1953 start_codon:yes stop_codon:yes gene_type:complete
MFFLRLYTYFFISFLGFLPSALIFSQTINDQVDEAILVTASRIPIPLSKVGSAYTLVEREEIEKRQIAYISDILRDIPGFSVSHSGSFGSQTQIRIRGAEANQVAVFIDGVKANDPAAGDEFQFDQLLTTEIERVEVIRGPQSALWGSDSIAGVINIITRKADGESFQSSSFAEMGNFNTSRLSSRFSLEEDKISMSLGASQLLTDGTNISRNETNGENDGYRNTTINLNTAYQVSENLVSSFFFRNTDTFRDFDGSENGFPIDKNNTTDASQRYLSFSLKGGSFRDLLQNEIRYTGLRTINTNNAVDSFGKYVLTTTSAKKEGIYFQSSFLLKRNFLHNIIFAMDHEKEDYNFNGQIPASKSYDPNQSQSIAMTGYVLEYQVPDIGSSSISASIRHDKNSDFADINTYRMTGTYNHNDFRLHASLGTGQKSPTFIERFGYYPNSFMGNPNLKPEHSKGWDIGIDKAFLRDTIFMNFTLFKSVLKNEINGYVVNLEGVASAANESDKSHRRGIEISLLFKLNDQLQINSSYTYTKSTEINNLGAEVKELRRPRNMFSTNINYLPNDKTNINLNLSYNGDRYDVYYPSWPSPSERKVLSGYSLVNFVVSHQYSNRLKLMGRIENLLDQDYEDVFGFNTPGRSSYLGFQLEY